MNIPRFYVTDGEGGFAETFVWFEAESLAIGLSKENNKAYMIQEEKHGDYVALFFDGKRYIPATGQICQSCLAPMHEDQAHYSYHLTGQFFCSEKCGIQLGILVNRNRFSEVE